MRKNLKKILCDYRQNCLFVVKYNKVVKIITDTSNCAFVFVKYMSDKIGLIVCCVYFINLLKI